MQKHQVLYFQGKEGKGGMVTCRGKGWGGGKVGSGSWAFAT